MRQYRQNAPLFFLFAAVVAFSLLSACKPQVAPSADSSSLKQSWKSQVTQQIAAAQNDHLAHKGGFYSEEIEILKNILNRAPPSQVKAENQRLSALEIIPAYSGNDRDLDVNYDVILLQALVEHCIDTKNTREHVTLLSRHCPQYMVYTALEFVLAIGWPNSLDPLFEAYRSAKSPATRKDILTCLGRAFPGLRARNPDDEKFVTSAQNWYAANRARLQVNERYEYVPAQPPPEPGEDRTNLFLLPSK